LGDAQSLPFPDASFDSCLALLVVSFIPNAPKPRANVSRDTARRLVATAMWDNTGGNDLNQLFGKLHLPLDPKAPQEKERVPSHTCLRYLH
jgi:hypothetical protein